MCLAQSAVACRCVAASHIELYNIDNVRTPSIVMTDALNIHEGTLKLKKEILQRRAA